MANVFTGFSRWKGSLVVMKSNQANVYIKFKDETHPYVNQPSTSFIVDQKNVFVIHQSTTFFIQLLSKLRLVKGDVL
jgi:hypothetical protein